MRAPGSTLVALGLAVFAACSAPPVPAPAPVGFDPDGVPTPTVTTASVQLPTLEPFGDLDVDPDSFDFKGHPELVGRIADSPHAYFRFTQRLFARAACKRFDKQLASAPRTRLHGDPHVEQYHVSDLGRGLTDFDDASVGPPFLDLARFATSTILAARVQGLAEGKQAALLNELFRGYRAGLEGKSLSKEPPAFASALVSKFKNDKKGFVLYLENQLEPIDAREDAFVREEVQTYATLQGKKGAKKPATYFDIKKMGRTKLGIGSALTRKYLVVLEGTTSAQEDDVVMELKEIADLTAVPCVKAIPSGAAEARALMQKIAGDKKLLSPVLLPDGKFWVNEWLTNYEEARIKKLLPTDLSDLVYEAGIALAEVHRMPLPDGPPPSTDTLRIDDALEKQIRAAAEDLARETIKGWERFRRDVKVKL